MNVFLILLNAVDVYRFLLETKLETIFKKQKQNMIMVFK